MFFEGFKGIIVKYIRPKVTVVSGSVSANDMIEVSDAVAGGNFGDQAELVHGFFFESKHIQILYICYHVKVHVEDGGSQ